MCHLFTGSVQPGSCGEHATHVSRFPAVLSGNRPLQPTTHDTSREASGRAETQAPSGGGGIRTLGRGVTPTTVFETARFNHSRTPPRVPREARGGGKASGRE